MPMRNIEAPGVEIHEIDKSGYSPAMTGSKCYVMGYSTKGTPYTPMIFTSKAAWQSFYGDPSNEAEKYFYNACSEVINQNGVLNCARIPYENKAKDKMVGFKFKVSNGTTPNPTAGEYLKSSTVSAWVDHDSDFEKVALKWTVDNKCYREIDGILENGLEKEDEYIEFYDNVIDAFNASYNKDVLCVRWSVDYYKVNVEESEKLSARFLTKKQAQNYLNEYANVSVKGLYKYDISQDNCLIYDQGDWIATPLYCEYFKESVVAENLTSNILSNYGDIPQNLYKQILKYNDVSSVWPEYKGKEISSLADITDKNVILGVATYLSSDAVCDDARIVKFSTDDEAFTLSLSGIIHATKTVQKENPIGDEICGYGYASTRKNKLTDTKTKIKVLKYLGEGNINGTKVLFKEEEVDVNEYIDIGFTADGADNEYMFNKTAQELYENEDWNLSSYEFMRNLWDEMFVPYKSRSLGKILRETAEEESEFIDSWSKMLYTYKSEGDLTFKKLYTDCGVTKERINVEVPYNAIVDLDSNLNNYLTITQAVLPVTCDLTAVDEYASGEAKVGANTFWVFDKTCDELKSISEDQRKGEKRQLIGIFPVITTAANALYAQSLIDVDQENVHYYETVNKLITKSANSDDGGDTSRAYELSASDIVVKLSQADRSEDEADTVIDTVSREANNYFSPIETNIVDGKMRTDSVNMKKIGVVVYKAYLDASEGNKVSFTPVEAFTGSLDKDAKNPNTGVSTFIDKIVNTQSDYIYFFSNCFCNATTKKIFDDEADFFVCKTGVTGMLGFFQDETKKTISLPSLYQGIDKCFQKVEDINERDIDIICDAGLANIAQFMKSVYGGATAQEYDLQATDDSGNPQIKLWTCKSASDVGAWKTVEFKYDNFCKNVRKDCMFIADGPRPLVLQGEKKIIRESKPSNTIDANILPNVKFITGLNTNYGAGYCDWFKVTDEFTGDEMWLPPSIKAMGVYINTDLNFNYWDAPAGLNRGVIQALDCAFSPTVKQAGQIYTKNWNYAINYPNDGIVLEGQKTFQVKPSAFDRVNVRRLFLRLERQSYKVARYFVYEGNTEYTRQRLVDALDPYFYQAKVGGGIYDYKIICDESVNTATVIDNNELRVKIGIKPVKAAEFIMIDFIALSTGGSFSEM